MSTTLRPEEPEMIDCEICLAHIPRDGAVNVESDEYVYHFCGIACYEKWRRSGGLDAGEAWPRPPV